VSPRLTCAHMSINLPEKNHNTVVFCTLLSAVAVISWPRLPAISTTPRMSNFLGRTAVIWYYGSEGNRDGKACTKRPTPLATTTFKRHVRGITGVFPTFRMLGFSLFKLRVHKGDLTVVAVVRSNGELKKNSPRARIEDSSYSLTHTSMI